MAIVSWVLKSSLHMALTPRQNNTYVGHHAQRVAFKKYDTWRIKGPIETPISTEQTMLLPYCLQ